MHVNFLVRLVLPRLSLQITCQALQANIKIDEDRCKLLSYMSFNKSQPDTWHKGIVHCSFKNSSSESTKSVSISTCCLCTQVRGLVKEGKRVPWCYQARHRGRVTGLEGWFSEGSANRRWNTKISNLLRMVVTAALAHSTSSSSSHVRRISAFAPTRYWSNHLNCRCRPKGRLDLSSYGRRVD